MTETWAKGRWYTADDLRDLPTLCVGQTDDLKIETLTERVWLCRCGIADGAQFREGITVERLIAGRWETVDEYEGATR